MAYLDNHSMYEFLDVYKQYENKIYVLFGYLNGRVNTKNICSVHVTGFSDDVYAYYQYPSNVVFYLGSLINNFMDDNDPKLSYDTIMSLAALCMAHELYHADQNIDSRKYKTDPNYAKKIEDGAQYAAEVYCYKHRYELKKTFGFNYIINISTAKTPYINFIDTGDYMKNCILGYFRNYDIYEEFKNLCDNEPNVALLVTTLDKSMKVLKIKQNAKFVTSLSEFSKFMNSLIHLNYLPYFKMRSIINTINVDNILFKCMIIQITGIEYDPFDIREA